MPTAARSYFTATAWTLGLGLTGAALVRAARPERWTADIGITAAVPWLLAPSWPLLVGAVVMRRRRLTVLAAMLAAYHATCVRPQLRPCQGRDKEKQGPELRVAFANVRHSNPEVRGILGELAAGEHDIVALAEVAIEHLDAIDDLLPASTYPWRTIEPDPAYRSKGLALLSRVPLDAVEKWSSVGHPQLEATVLVPRARPFRLFVVHTWGPVGKRGIIRWRAQLAELAARAQRRDSSSPAHAQGAGADDVTLMIGDFNATFQHRSFARLVGDGWRDAGDLRFGGWRATWPANRSWRPPVLKIDHILVPPSISVRRARAGRARGSDHRPVSAVLGLVPLG